MTGSLILTIGIFYFVGSPIYCFTQYSEQSTQYGENFYSWYFDLKRFSIIGKISYVLINSFSLLLYSILHISVWLGIELYFIYIKIFYK